MSYLRHWWKVVCALLMSYTIIGGLVVPVPELQILHESIRNLFYHVPMWFGMTILLLVAAVYSIRYLITGNLKDDAVAAAAVQVAVLFGTLGLLTGMIWARVTWGAWWVNDPKLMGAAVGLLLYLAYFVLRGSIDDLDKRARIAAVANIMFYAIFIPAIFIVPRLTESLHPGSGGNPAFNTYDLDENMRWVFYPAVAGWTLLGVWIITLAVRLRRLELIRLGGPDILSRNAVSKQTIE